MPLLNHKVRRRVFAGLASILVTAGGGLVWAQSAQQVPPPSPSAISTPAIAWSALTPPQQIALAPLQSTWTSLPDASRRKWIALSQNFASMSPADRDKLQARMAEWAALKPSERQQARLNFADTKKTPPDQREAHWEAYQALSAEEKAALASKAPAKPAGAAVAAKPPPSHKLTPVPITRNSPEAQREKLIAQQPINRNTLLPLPASPALAPEIKPAAAN
jgi:hypothetical protein